MSPCPRKDCESTEYAGSVEFRARTAVPSALKHALIAELLGRQVRIRQDGAAVFARLEIDEAVLLASAAKSLEVKDFQVGSGGRI